MSIQIIRQHCPSALLLKATQTETKLITPEFAYIVCSGIPLTTSVYHLNPFDIFMKNRINWCIVAPAINGENSFNAQCDALLVVFSTNIT
jgi:hypothetical protein